MKHFLDFKMFQIYYWPEFIIDPNLFWHKGPKIPMAKFDAVTKLTQIVLLNIATSEINFQIMSVIHTRNRVCVTVNFAACWLHCNGISKDNYGDEQTMSLAILCIIKQKLVFDDDWYNRLYNYKILKYGSN